MPLRVILCWISLFGLAGAAAAEGLPSLRVDPALLGGASTASDAPAPQPAGPVQSAPPAQPVILDAPQRVDAVTAQPAPQPATVPAPVRQAAPAAAPIPAPRVAEAPAPAASSPAAPTPESARPSAAAVVESAPRTAPQVTSLAATRTASGSTLPPLRVDPALLVGTPAQREQPSARSVSAAPQQQATGPAVAAAGQASPAALTQTTEPPQVAERPPLPPLYSAHVAAGELPAPKLKPARALTPLSRDSAESRPNFLSADRIRGRTDVEMVAEGAAQLRKVGTALDADQLTYWHLDDEVEALGNVRLVRDQDVYTGPKLRMKIEESTGFFEQPNYTMVRTTTLEGGTEIGGGMPQRISTTTTGRGEAERIEFQGEGLYRLSKATYSTCAPGNNDWYAEVADLNLDYNREVAEGSDGKVMFKGMPILYSPWLSFSLNNQRKSGLLSPTFGTTNTSGPEVSVPWYWNIAPNMDATITPRIMQKRGTQLNTEVRYVEGLPAAPTYMGQTQIDYLPDDRIENKRRFGYSILHSQNLGYGFAGSLNLNGVSDDTYFRDLTRPGSLVAQNYLSRAGTLSYGAPSGWWGASIAAQRYQVLQDPALPPVAEPYRRLPQINLFANRYDLPLGSAFNFSGEFVRFEHPTSVIGQRTVMYPQVSLPIQTSFLQVTPKFGLHETRYALERQDAGTPDSLRRSVPIFSLDSSAVLERDTDFFGRSMTQTLEPRLYYLYVPNRDQSQIPVFDTGVAGFTFAQIFAENRYAGGDRIADANQLTAAVTSRLIDPTTGAELIRGAVGQLYYFTDQHVTIPGETPRTGRSADFLAAVSGQVLPKTYVDTGWQYNPRDKQTERLTIGGRYQPEIGKVLNAGYRYDRSNLLGQIDVSGQWPLGGGWYGVGRYNYSTHDRRMIESVAGLEYDGGCWVGRIVIRSVATQTQQATSSLFFQLELNGFSRLGTNPIDILKRSVPGYWRMDQISAGTSLLPH